MRSAILVAAAICLLAGCGNGLNEGHEDQRLDARINADGSGATSDALRDSCTSQDGQCVPDCGGKPCPCRPGETQVCDDVGECKGGSRKCINGTFGPCEWTVGPQTEVCDGKDNDCTDTPDDNLVAESCAKQQGVCQGAVKKCGGTAGWLPCADSDYQAWAQSKGLSYEATETLCDGKDNDCNGKIDEPASCCQPNCTNKACGADDGCGTKCQVGSCALPQETCQGGTCVCQPSCTGKICGGPDGCGGSCAVGTCGSKNEICNAGSCVCAYLICNGSCCAAGEVCNSGVCAAGPAPGWKVVAAITKQPLLDVWGSGSNDVWAVGGYGTILHYNNGAWAAVNSGTTAMLKAIWGSGPDDIWAVSDESSAILHYDGAKWSSSTPSYSDGRYNDVWGTSSKDVWIAGRHGTPASSLLVHYDGAAWKVVQPNQSEILEVVWTDATDNVWIGAYGWKFSQYDGASWTKQNTVGYFGPWAIVGNGPSDVWAAGDEYQIKHFDGNAWLAVSSPVSGQYRWYAISKVSASDMWIVGDWGNIAHYNGQGWSLSGIGVTTYTLRGVWAASASEAWAVGDEGTLLHFTP